MSFTGSHSCHFVELLQLPQEQVERAAQRTDHRQPEDGAEEHGAFDRHVEADLAKQFRVVTHNVCMRINLRDG